MYCVLDVLVASVALVVTGIEEAMTASIDNLRAHRQGDAGRHTRTIATGRAWVQPASPNWVCTYVIVEVLIQ